MRTGFYFITLLVLTSAACGGREPSRALRQGQLPVNGFPLYLSDGASGTIYKFNSDRSREDFATGLNNPLGIATDRYNHLYVVEQGASRLLKYNTTSRAMTVIAEGLQSPSVVAVDDFGEAFVAQDTPHSVLRATDRSVIGDFYSLPSALVMGVNNILIVGDFNANRVYWGGRADSAAAEVRSPVNVAIDGIGRVYVAEGLFEKARVIRFHQDGPGAGGHVIVDALSGPQGIAVDPVGNVYVVEKGKMRVTLVTHDGQVYSWVSGLTDPQYLAFTQY